VCRLAVTIDGRTVEVQLDLGRTFGQTLQVKVGDHVAQVVLPDLNAHPGDFDLIFVDGRPYNFICDPELHSIEDPEGLHQVQIRNLEAPISPCRRGDGRVKAPVPGQIVDILALPGEAVELGQPLLILEAMKMENELLAPCSGKVQRVCVAQGEDVKRGQILLEIQSE
jgi:biotin carboxyl carrier protein